MPDNTAFIPVKDPNMGFERTQNKRLEMDCRLTSFDEVEQTYTEEQALSEASRCLKCPTHWCQKNCPADVPVTDFIAKVRARDYEGAYQLITTASTLPEFCSRVCPQEKQCQSDCTRSIRSQAVGIGRLERFVVERHNMQKAEGTSAAVNGKTVAVIGSGPSGLSVAQRLADLGFSVTVFERADRAGGLLEYGIPNMKIEKGVLSRRLAAMADQGVTFRTGVTVGTDVTADALKTQFDAVVLCVGAGTARGLKLENGDGVKGIYPAVQYLTAATKQLNHSGQAISAEGRDVIIVGGGDTGSDCVGTAIRQGCASVREIEMLPRIPARQHIHSPYPARPAERKTDTSQEECLVRFCRDPHLYQTTVKAVQTDETGQIQSVTAVSLRAAHQEGRLIMEEIPGTEKTLPCGMLIIATGFMGPERDLLSAFQTSVTARGNVDAADYATGIPGVYACGDCRTGQSLVVKAMKDGLRCADRIAADFI